MDWLLQRSKLNINEAVWDYPEKSFEMSFRMPGQLFLKTA